MPNSELPLYFVNAAGQVHAHLQRYVLVCYSANCRHGTDLAVLLTHAGELLRAKDWHCVLSDQRRMVPYSPAEESWVNA